VEYIKYLNDFVSKFCDMKIENVIYINENFFLVLDQQKKIIESLFLKPVFAGEFLGTFKKDRKVFFPSITLIKMISKKCKKKVILNKKGSFLFLCGRDLMNESIVIYEEEIKKGDYVLVFDNKDDCIGYGEAITDLSNRRGGIVIRNKLDLGDFLRREMTKKTKR
jgi:predicted RNA-binding protein (TIGR00451 family)